MQFCLKTFWPPKWSFIESVHGRQSPIFLTRGQTMKRPASDTLSMFADMLQILIIGQKYFSSTKKIAEKSNNFHCSRLQKNKARVHHAWSFSVHWNSYNMHLCYVLCMVYYIPTYMYLDSVNCNWASATRRPLKSVLRNPLKYLN
jgi:hypothetical protein